MHPELIYICCLCWNINLPGDHGYFSHAGLLLFMSIHSGSSALDRVYWGRDLLGFPQCWLLHGGSAGCWCTCGSKCKGTIEPERKMPLFSLCFCSTLALADDSFQSMFLSAAVPAVSAFLLRCPHQSHRGSLPYARCPLYSDIPFPITELEELLGMVWDRVGWPGLLWLWYSITPEVIIWEYPRPPLQCELVYAGVKTACGSRVEVLDFFLLGLWVQTGLMEWFLLQRHFLVKGSWQLASSRLGKPEAVEYFCSSFSSCFC